MKHSIEPDGSEFLESTNLHLALRIGFIFIFWGTFISYLMISSKVRGLNYFKHETFMAALNFDVSVADQS